MQFPGVPAMSSSNCCAVWQWKCSLNRRQGGREGGTEETQAWGKSDKETTSRKGSGRSRDKTDKEGKYQREKQRERWEKGRQKGVKRELDMDKRTEGKENTTESQ